MKFSAQRWTGLLALWLPANSLAWKAG